MHLYIKVTTPSQPPAAGVPPAYRPGVPAPRHGQDRELLAAVAAFPHPALCVVPNVKGDTLREAISEQVEMGATILVTDEARAYQQFAGEMKGHERVVHSHDEYVNADGFTTNQVEAYFGQLKRSIDGTHHAVSKVHLHRYLAQHDFLRSTYKLDDSLRMRLLVDQTTGRRLTYKPLTGQ